MASQITEGQFYYIMNLGTKTFLTAPNGGSGSSVVADPIDLANPGGVAGLWAPAPDPAGQTKSYKFLSVFTDLNLYVDSDQVGATTKIWATNANPKQVWDLTETNVTALPPFFT